MLIYNLDIKSHLINGSRGIIVNFINDLPAVKFLNGVEMVIGYHIWEVENNDQKLMRIIQIPLKIAFAISIHKSQGTSLDLVEVDLRNIFTYGMAYVALSRVRNIEGLSIIGLDEDKIKVHPKVVKYYESLK